MFKIISDTPCDYTIEYAESVGVTLVPLYVSFDGEHYQKDQFELSTEDFYQKIINEKVYPKTSLPSVQDYIDAFMPYVEAGTPIISISISTIFSGSYNSARMAAEQILEDYPDAKITVLNSELNSGAQGLLVYEAVRMNKDNVPYEKAVEILDKIRTIGTVYFTIDSLDYLKKGGRIGQLAKLISGALSIRPSLYLKNGEINISGISRTRKKAINHVFESVKKYFVSNNIDPSTYDISTETANGKEECDELRNRIEEALNIKCVESREHYDTRVGMITGCHTGAYTAGIGIMPKYELFM